MNTVQTIILSESDRNTLNAKRKVVPFEFIDSEVNSALLSMVPVLKSYAVYGSFILHNNYSNALNINHLAIKNNIHHFNRIS